MKLVIVESPTKAKTISRFLGDEYVVESSYGHVRDLPRSGLGVDPEKNFELHYVIPRRQQKMVTQLKKKAAKADEIVLATDEDREGEAIAWHLLQALTPKGKEPLQAERIVFHEITKEAILSALKHPRELNLNLVNAQQARRALDRLVGYKLSPFLWKKVVRGLSAGRVQSVAVRLIVERENEIKAFKPQAYYLLDIQLKTPSGDLLSPSISEINGTAFPKPGLLSREEAEQALTQLQASTFSLTAIEKREMRKNPPPPFITSTLQQASAHRLRFSSKKTMFLAQGLYERGLITYMRTDSVNLSQEALLVAKEWIGKELGENYTTHAPRTFKSTSRLAQEAHEAIRPTDIKNLPEKLKLEKDEARLYDLIWKRFVSSQLPPALFENTRYEIEAKSEAGIISLAVSGSILVFDGFLRIWPSAFSESLLPVIQKGATLLLENGEVLEKFTEPPARYTEAALIKILEKYGIGRPSTYAPTISVIQERNYVVKEQGHFVPTEMGNVVNQVLTEHFPEIVDIQFTVNMENQLDEVATGEKNWQEILRHFYEPFAKQLEAKYESVEKHQVEEKTDQICELCGKPMIIRLGRFGRFLSCSAYPECKNAKALPKAPPKSTGVKCEKCGEGELLERRVSRGRARGKMFWGCSRYPECNHAVWKNPLGESEEPATEPAE